MATIQPITTLEKLARLTTQNNAPFLIELYAPWCTRCKKLESALQLAAPNCDMYKINIDADPFMDEPEFESVTSLPCVWLYKNGKKTELKNPSVEIIIEHINLAYN